VIALNTRGRQCGRVRVQLEKGPADEGHDTRLTCLVLVLAVLLPPLMLGLTIGCPAAACGATLYLAGALDRDLAEGQDWLVGIVESGEFQPLLRRRPLGGSCRLTRMPMQAARSPESEEIDLLPYEGSVIVVRGHDGGGWIYSAEVIADGGPILGALVRLFRGLGGGAMPGCAK